MKVRNGPAPFLAVGAFAADEAARRAVQQLLAAGNTNSSISIASQINGSERPSEMPVLSRVFWRGFWWSIVGAVGGAIVGLAIGLMGLGVPGTPDGIAIQIASWAMFAHVLGALLGCYLALDTGDRFAHKADHHDASASLVRVQSSDADSLVIAKRILREAGAYSVDSPSGQHP